MASCVSTEAVGGSGDPARRRRELRRGGPGPVADGRAGDRSHRRLLVPAVRTSHSPPAPVAAPPRHAAASPSGASSSPASAPAAAPSPVSRRVAAPGAVPVPTAAAAAPSRLPCRPPSRRRPPPPPERPPPAAVIGDGPRRRRRTNRRRRPRPAGRRGDGRRPASCTSSVGARRLGLGAVRRGHGAVA